MMKTAYFLFLVVALYSPALLWASPRSCQEARCPPGYTCAMQQKCRGRGKCQAEPKCSPGSGSPGQPPPGGQGAPNPRGRPPGGAPPGGQGHPSPRGGPPGGAPPGGPPQGRPAPQGRTPPIPTCRGHQCPPGEICMMRPEFCFREPCHPEPTCIAWPPTPRVTRPTCSGYVCSAGEWCRMQVPPTCAGPPGTPCPPGPTCVPDDRPQQGRGPSTGGRQQGRGPPPSTGQGSPSQGQKPPSPPGQGQPPSSPGQGSPGRGPQNPSCQGTQCPPGEWCVMMKEKCDNEPCRPQPTCVDEFPHAPQGRGPPPQSDRGRPGRGPEHPTCRDHECPDGEVCFMEVVTCVTTPCLPQPNCKVAPVAGLPPPPDTCDGFKCPPGQECTLKPDRCNNPPCPQKPSCGRRRGPRSCAEAHCPHGRPCVMKPYVCHSPNCRQSPSCAVVRKCRHGQPLKDSQRTEIFCGLGGQDCPDTHFCNIAPDDSFAVCCREQPGPRTCANARCPAGRECVMTPRWCRRPPCKQRPSCAVTKKCMNGQPLRDSQGNEISCGLTANPQACPSTHHCVTNPPDYAVCCRNPVPKKCRFGQPLRDSQGNEISCGLTANPQACPSTHHCVTHLADYAVCCRSPVCRSGFEYNTCGSVCPKTCAEPDPDCTEPCRDGCFCPAATPIYHAGRCIAEADCPSDG